MISILVAICFCGAVGVFLLYFNEAPYIFLGTVAVGLSLLSAFIYILVAWDWYAAEYKTEIINSAYHTNYTQEQVFWANSVIDEIRQLDRKRIELNGDLMRGQCEEMIK